jgi:copper chaperone CopZ
MDSVNAKVSGDRQEAVIKMGRTIDDGEIKSVIENLGYKVVSIEERP